MKDILLDSTGELKIENGDFVVGLSENQHQLDILISEHGDFKEHPEIGVGIDKLTSDDEFTSTLIKAKKNLQYDGMRIRNIYFKQDGELFIEGKYN